jgi:hypothetical protein
LSSERKMEIVGSEKRWLRLPDSLRRASAHGALAVSLEKFRDELAGTPGRNRGTGLWSNKTCETNCNRGQKSAEVSGHSAGNRRRERLIREEIIGHRMRASRGAGRGEFAEGMRSRALALFHQPAREHRTGIFFQPLIEQRAYFFAQICSMAKTGQFVGLQRSARSR